MARQRSIEELSEDFQWLMKEHQRLRNRLDAELRSINTSFVRADFHDEQIGNIKDRLDSLHTMQMWILGILAAIFVSGVVTIIGAIARSGFG